MMLLKKNEGFLKGTAEPAAMEETITEAVSPAPAAEEAAAFSGNAGRGIALESFVPPESNSHPLLRQNQ